MSNQPTPPFKVGDIVRVCDATLFISSFAKKISDRDAVVEFVGPDNLGRYNGRMKVRFLKRDGRGKEFTEIMNTRMFAIKKPA